MAWKEIALLDKVDWVFCDQGTKPPTIHCERCGERVPLQFPEGWTPVDAFTSRLKGFTMMHSQCLPNAAQVKPYTAAERAQRNL